MMTLRQVEVIRAVMVTGTIGGAAKLLNVSAPGISRLVKYTEKSLGVRFFQRQNGRYFPTPEAQNADGEFFQIYTPIFDERFFFEIVQRRNYEGFGAPNAAIRLAAQTREVRPPGMPRLG